jgi:hypothetical protein
MKTFINTKNGRVEIEEPEINKLYEELTRLVLISNHWENEQYRALMRICLRARNKKKLIYAHDTKHDKQINEFFTNKIDSKNNFGIFVTGVSVLIDWKEVTPAEAYILLIRMHVCNYKRNNVFGVVRKGNIFSKHYDFLVKEKERR